jgi:hypothetical protein
MLNICCFSQTRDTTYVFRSPPLQGLSRLNSLKDTVVGRYALSLKLDSTESDVQYVEIRDKEGEILYEGIFKNELLHVEVKDENGKILNPSRYKLTEVYPTRAHIHVLGDSQVKDRYEVRGFVKEFVKDGYFTKYKNGQQISRVYYSEGKILKMKL